MCAAALQKVQLDTAYLRAGFFFQHLRQNRGKTAQLRMTEAVIGGNLCFGNEVAIGIVDAFRHSDNAVALFCINTLDVINKALHVKIDLRQIDQVRTCAVDTGQRRGGSQPTGVAAHDLHYHDHACIINAGVLVDLHH